MTTDNSEIKQSYTQQLLDHLSTKKIPKKYLDEIRVFSIEYANKMNEENKLNQGLLTWGKYKNKLLTDVMVLDKPYLTWLSKNKKYLSEQNQEVLNELLNSQSPPSP